MFVTIFQICFVVLTLAQHLNLVEAAVALTDFLPYLEEHGASRWNFSDNSFLKVELGYSLSYFGSLKTNIYIMDNGIVSFNGGTGQRARRSSAPCKYGCHWPSILALWADFCPHETSQITYSTIWNGTALQRLSLDISRTAAENGWTQHQTDLYAAFAVTWKDVYYLNDAETSTFQMILTTDGAKSFVLLYYNKVQLPKYWSGTAGLLTSSGAAAYTLPGSNTLNAMQTVLEQSNVGVPGKWMFRVDMNTLEKFWDMYSFRHSSIQMTSDGQNKFINTMLEGKPLFKVNAASCFDNAVNGTTDCIVQISLPQSPSSKLIANQLSTCKNANAIEG